MRIAAGILTLIGGLIGGSLFIGILRASGIYGALLILPLVIATIGGIMALKRENYGWALAGAICSLLFPPFGIPAIILLVKRRREFKGEKEHECDSYKRGDAYYEMGEYSKAIAEYNKAIETNPNHALAYFNRAYAYGEIGNYDKAIADYSKIIELNPGDAQAYYNRGLDYYNNGEVSKAVSDLERCIELSADPELTKDAQQALLETRNSPQEKKME
jgi:tetratricopeptide (TPR) repeat protein